MVHQQLDGLKTTEQVLTGGNVVVHGSSVGSTTTTTTSARLIAGDTVAGSPVFNVKIMPTPSSTYFTLRVLGSSNEAADIRVFDMSGRLVEQARGATGASIRLGARLTHGMYIVEVHQGKNHSTLKAQKL